uniref:GLOBIN domain-containing protein n=1 Tax=Caenorhabditis japonica TaxID=281687 RepID=A0A8R1HTL7_CAEJA
MGHAHSSPSTGSSTAAASSHDEKTKEKVEKLFRQNNRTNRSRSLDNRAQEQKLPNRPVGSSHSARFPKSRHIPLPTQGPRKSEDGLCYPLAVRQKEKKDRTPLPGNQVHAYGLCEATALAKVRFVKQSRVSDETQTKESGATPRHATQPTRIAWAYKRFKKKSHLPISANGSISGLSRDDKRIIETCWFKCSPKQLRKCSCDMFWDILHTDEEILRLFRLDHVAPNRLKDNDYFKSHASNLALVLNLVVTNIQDNFEQAQDALQTLGYQHLHLIDRSRFQSMYWDIFTDCFERNPPPSFKKGAEREVWSRMILFIMAQMKTGYQRAIQEEKCERLSVPLLM